MTHEYNEKLKDLFKKQMLSIYSVAKIYIWNILKINTLSYTIESWIKRPSSQKIDVGI